MYGHSLKIPGIYIDEVYTPPLEAFRAGVPVFMGYATDGAPRPLGQLNRWEHFVSLFGKPQHDRFLAYAVRGFFANGGELCHVCCIDRGEPIASALAAGLNRLAGYPQLPGIDLMAIPEIGLFPEQALLLQQMMLDFCRIRLRENGAYIFALLDSVSGADCEGVIRQKNILQGDDAALYYPWIRVQDGPSTSNGCIPPCGHIAGIYSRSDRENGVHKAPANEMLAEALDLETVITDAVQQFLNPANVNSLRSFPGRGIRVWGARSLGGGNSPAYLNFRRTILAVSRWVEQKMAAMLFEPNDDGIWRRIRREIDGYLAELHRKGAFRGGNSEEAYFVKCDSENNSQEIRDRGELVVEIGLALAAPAEFIIIRIVQTESGTKVDTGNSIPSLIPLPVAGSGASSADGPVLCEILADIAGPDLAGEYIRISNQGKVPVDMTNWLLKDLAGHEYLFPQFTLHPGADVRIWTKSGENSLGDLYWGHSAPLWNNTGDVAFLYDSQKRPVSTLSYEPMGKPEKSI